MSKGPTRGRTRTNRARAIFTATLEATCNVSEAARTAGMARSAVYELRDKDPTFAAAWDEALEAAADKLEQVAHERAYSGDSDRMLEILLKAHRPKYREKQVHEVTGTIIHSHEAAKREVDELFGPTPHQIEAGHG